MQAAINNRLSMICKRECAPTSLSEEKCMAVEARDIEAARADPQPRWTLETAREAHDAPFNDLLFQAQTVHRANFDPNRVQLSKLLNIKTGGCPEDCGYCSQSAHHATGLKASRLAD